MGTAPTALRAIGIVRVSQTNGREGESFSSPRDQEDRIRELADREGWILLDILYELDVSGDALLEDREKLSRAVTAVLTGGADVIASAHTERLWWNQEVRGQVLRLVEAAGGEVWSADQGRLTNGSAADEFSGTVRTAADRLSRRQNSEKSRAAVKRAIARGIPPWPNITPGYRRKVVGTTQQGEPVYEGKLLADPEKRHVVVQACQRRVDGASIRSVQAFLAEHGIVRSYHGVATLLSSRVLLGEIHFGDLVNLEAHEPIVSVELWQAVQRVKVPRGRRAQSDRLLARLGVLRCASCEARMVVGTSKHGTYHMYRCPPTGDCAQRVTISAERVEARVVEAVREVIADSEGRASVEQNAQQAVLALERAQADLDAAFRAFDGFAGEAAARDRLSELRQVRDAAQEQVDQQGGNRAAITVSGAADWDLLALDEQRDLIRATVKRVAVVPGRGAGRITVELVGGE